jgi:hypothetical protein
MDWHTPADAHWANNYTVICHARIDHGKASVRYVAMHLPTRHTEEGPFRKDALKKLLQWISLQPEPTCDALNNPYGPAARRKAVQDRIQDLGSPPNEVSEHG